MRDGTAKSGAQRVAEHRARMQEKQMEFNRQATAARGVVYAMERLTERNVKLALDLQEVINPFETVEAKLTALANAMLDLAEPKKPKRNRAPKAATNGTHSGVPASTVQETVSRIYDKSATVRKSPKLRKERAKASPHSLIGG